MEPTAVFVDASGRRRRRLRMVGLLVAVLTAGYLVLVLVAVAGGSRVPVTSWVDGPVSDAGTDGSGDGTGTSGKPRRSATPAPTPAVSPSPAATAAPTRTATPRPTIATTNPGGQTPRGGSNRPTSRPDPTRSSRP